MASGSWPRMRRLCAINRYESIRESACLSLTTTPCFAATSRGLITTILFQLVETIEKFARALEVIITRATR